MRVCLHAHTEPDSHIRIKLDGCVNKTMEVYEHFYFPVCKHFIEIHKLAIIRSVWFKCCCAEVRAPVPGISQYKHYMAQQRYI